MKLQAVYAITHVATGRHYVGSSRDVRARWKAHTHMLRKGEHHSPHLQRAWSMYGEESFAFAVLERVEHVDDLLQCEQVWIDRLHAGEPTRGFNTAPVAGTRAGVSHSEATKQKMSATRKGRPMSPEHRAAIGAANKGKKRTAEMNAATSSRLKSEMKSADRRARSSVGGKKTGGQNRGTVASDTARAKMSESAQRKTLIRDDAGRIVAVMTEHFH